ncbi:S66 peptidase family protein [Legionella tunisiensis]|uniref:S66 peptidase family protein n=1 Tax=Legionella tunisiensis TaxID=1034944 RepID=UPI0002EF8555|nr:LD-carboxypeptidase [Legionella tunisiensis]
MRGILLKPLREGDTIGIVAPSSPLQQEDIEKGIGFLQQLGFNLKLGAHLYERDRFLAGSDEKRAQDVMNFFADSSVQAIFVARGGQGSQRILPLLDYSIISKNPKKLVGFSDTTALQLGLFKQSNLVSYSGYTLTTKTTPLLEKTLLACLTDEAFQINEGEVGNPGIVRGILVGGNLSLLTSLIGTPYQPNFKKTILLLEDVNIEPYNVDRMLSHIDLAGIFNQVSGVIFGQFENCFSESTPADGSITQVIHEWIGRLSVPCIKDFPYGHGIRKCVVPIGREILLDADSVCVSVE